MSSVKWQPYCWSHNVLILQRKVSISSHLTIQALIVRTYNASHSTIKCLAGEVRKLMSRKQCYTELEVQTSAIIMRSNLTKYCTHHCSDWGRIYMKVGTHKRHPIPQPNGQAMVSFVRISERTDCVITALNCTKISARTSDYKSVLQIVISNHGLKMPNWIECCPEIHLVHVPSVVQSNPAM